MKGLKSFLAEVEQEQPKRKVGKAPDRRARYIKRDTVTGRSMRLDTDALAVLEALRQELGEDVIVACVDPSIRSAGWALGAFDGESMHMLSAGVECVADRENLPGLIPVPLMVNRIFEQIKAAHVLVFEHPVIYPTAQVENPNHLMPLMAVLGGLMCAKDWINPQAYTPREWKGDIPKEVHQERHLRKFPKEWITTNLPDHNAADAALLLYWYTTEELGINTTWSK